MIRRPGPLGIFLAATVAFAVSQTLHVIAGTAPSAEALRLTELGLSLSLVLWVVADAQSRRITPCYDFGFLTAVFFPVSIAWYAIRSRGWKGVLTLIALLGLIYLPWASAYAAWMLKYGSR
ncbi:hypothetical protein EP7_000996 [Isosphaeraceae bacterium EP7]